MLLLENEELKEKIENLEKEIIDKEIINVNEKFYRVHVFL